MKVVSGAQEGATGMVVKVEQHVLIILSDTTKEHVSDFFSFSFMEDTPGLKNTCLAELY